VTWHNSENTTAYHCRANKYYYYYYRFTALWSLSGTALVSWYQKGKTKTNLNFLEQEIVSGAGFSWAICKCAPCPWQITMPASRHSLYYRPDVSKYWWHQNCKNCHGEVDDVYRCLQKIISVCAWKFGDGPLSQMPGGKPIHCAVGLPQKAKLLCFFNICTVMGVG